MGHSQKVKEDLLLLFNIVQKKWKKKKKEDLLIICRKGKHENGLPPEFPNC